MSADPFDTEEWSDFSERVVRDMLPKMKESELVVSIATGREHADVKLAVEIGFCLLLGKPLVLMADMLSSVPAGLQRAADEIVYGEIQHPKTQAKLREAMARIAPDVMGKPAGEPLRYSWTQPICEDCFLIRQPNRMPVRVKDVGDPETCVDCGGHTSDGIFLRVDPATAKHPTRVKD